MNKFKYQTSQNRWRQQCKWTLDLKVLVDFIGEVIAASAPRTAPMRSSGAVNVAKNKPIPPLISGKTYKLNPYYYNIHI